MTPSPALVEFIKREESCRLEPYLDDAGYWTVGWGHKLPANDLRGKITQEEADALLAADLEVAAHGLAARLIREPSQQQFDALVSLAFNEGVRAISGSTLMMHVNRGEWDEASYQFTKWVYEHRNGKLVISAGLAKRRAAERKIFDDADYSGAP